MRPPPAYQEYPSDLLANEHYKLMEMDERGLFHSLRHYCWVNGSVPSDDAGLSELLGITVSYLDKTFSHRVRHFFRPSDSDSKRLICPELVDYKQELREKSDRKAMAGRVGGLRSAQVRAENQVRVQAVAQADAEMSEAERKKGEASRGEFS